MKRGLCPDFPVMVNDWLSSTQVTMMSAAEEGGYWRLLCHAWNDADCCLPDDDEALAQLSRLGPAWHQGSGARIRRCFESDPERPGFIFNSKQRATRTAQAQRIQEANDRCAMMRRNKAEKNKASFERSLQGSCKEPLQESAKSLVNALSSPLSPHSTNEIQSVGADAPSPAQPGKTVKVKPFNL